MDAPTCRERLAAVRLPEGNTATSPGHGEEADTQAERHLPTRRIGGLHLSAPCLQVRLSECGSSLMRWFMRFPL